MPFELDEPIVGLITEIHRDLPDGFTFYERRFGEKIDVDPADPSIPNGMALGPRGFYRVVTIPIPVNARFVVCDELMAFIVLELHEPFSDTE